jgi:fumarate reductase subunit D
VAIVVGFNILLIAVCAYAFWRGGPPERWAAVACLVAAAATLLIPLPRQYHFRTVETEILMIDVALLAALTVIAMKANRFWPLWATAAHSTAVAVHLAKVANPALVWPVYAFASSSSSLVVILLLWWGTLRHQRRLKRLGTDAPWRLT